MLTSPYSEEQLSQPIDMQSWKTFTLFCHTPNLTIFSSCVSKLLETSTSNKLWEKIIRLWSLSLQVSEHRLTTGIVKVSRSPKKLSNHNFSQMNNFFFYPDNWEILETWISISSFKYFRTVRIEKQIGLFLFGRSYVSLILF